MRTYARVLALVSVTSGAEAVLRRAMQLSRFHGATLALAAVVDYAPGFECDHVPFLTPVEMQRAIVRDVRGKLEGIASEAGCRGGLEILVACGGEERLGDRNDERSLAGELLRSWRPDLVLVGSRAPHGMDKLIERSSFDLLIVQNGRPGFTGWLINALAGAW